jgi:hypothetical protein
VLHLAGRVFDTVTDVSCSRFGGHDPKLKPPAFRTPWG